MLDLLRICNLFNLQKIMQKSVEQFDKNNNTNNIVSHLQDLSNVSLFRIQSNKNSQNILFSSRTILLNLLSLFDFLFWKKISLRAKQKIKFKYNSNNLCNSNYARYYYAHYIHYRSNFLEINVQILEISFTVFRSISLITQILFLIIVEKLYKRFLLNLQNLLKNEQQTKRQKSHFFQLKILCYISFIGSVILLMVNFIYMLSSDCRIVPHFGNGEYNFSDELNALVHTMVKLFTYFVPIILTLVLFTTKSQKEETNTAVFEVEDLTNQQYFQSLAFYK